MNEVWLVVGYVGRGQVRSWGVVAYPCEDVARLHVELANNELKCIGTMPVPEMAEFARSFVWDNITVDQLYERNLHYKCYRIDFALHPDHYLERGCL